MNSVKRLLTRSKDEKTGNHSGMRLDSVDQAVNNLKTYFKAKTDSENVCEKVVPQLGFKVSFCETSNELQAKVIGARQLPTEFGTGKPRGYTVKVINYCI